jgi:hypothetical protein
MNAKELGEKIAKDPDWVWQPGMLDGFGLRLISKDQYGWLAVDTCMLVDGTNFRTVRMEPNYPDIHDPVTRLWMRDFAPRLVGEWVFDNKYGNQG